MTEYTNKYLECCNDLKKINITKNYNKIENSYKCEYENCNKIVYFDGEINKCDRCKINLCYSCFIYCKYCKCQYCEDCVDNDNICIFCIKEKYEIENCD